MASLRYTIPGQASSTSSPPGPRDLERVRARRGIGQVADVEGGAQLRRTEKGN